MDESPIFNPFDEDDRNKKSLPGYSAEMSPLDADSGGRLLVCLIVGVAAIGCGLFFAAAMMVSLFRSTTEEEWIDVVDFTNSSVTEAGEANRITVIGRGLYFIFLINHVIVAEAEEDRIPGRTTALAIQIYEAGLKATIAFDNFELRAP